jgi:hypothetical protein
MHDVYPKIQTGGPVEAFEAGRQEFLRSIASSKRLELSETQTVEDIYDATDHIQEEQGSKQSLRNLNRIKQYLKRSGHYASVIKTFVKVEPVHTGIIWVCQYSCQVERSTESIRHRSNLYSRSVMMPKRMPVFELIVFVQRLQARTSAHSMRLSHLCLNLAKHFRNLTITLACSGIVKSSNTFYAYSIGISWIITQH